MSQSSCHTILIIFCRAVHHRCRGPQLFAILHRTADPQFLIVLQRAATPCIHCHASTPQVQSLLAPALFCFPPTPLIRSGLNRGLDQRLGFFCSASELMSTSLMPAWHEKLIRLMAQHDPCNGDWAMPRLSAGLSCWHGTTHSIIVLCWAKAKNARAWSSSGRAGPAWPVGQV
jgi:hypothetical protein